MRWTRGINVRNAVVAGCAVLAGALAANVRASAATLPEVLLGEQNAVPACVTPERLMHFLAARNRYLDPRFRTVAGLYASYGARLGVRWDIAFFQMLVETANLTFRRLDGTPGDVAPEHNNFAGIGAIGDGRPGETFATIEQGVRAHLEHVKHYAGIEIEAPVAERTRKVQVWKVLAEWHRAFERPITYSDLARRWAPHSESYRATIERIATIFQDRYCAGRPVLMVERSSTPSIGETAWRSDGKPAERVVTAAALPLSTAPATAWPTRQRPVTAAPRRREPASVVASLPVTPAPEGVKRFAAGHRLGRVTEPTRPKPPRRAPRLTANDRVRLMIADRKVLLRTSIGAVVPIVYDRDGRMRGEAGSLSFFLGSSEDKGRWWVRKGKLCQKWRIWLDRETHCMRLQERRGTIWWWADDGKSGTARIVSK